VGIQLADNSLADTRVEGVDVVILLCGSGYAIPDMEWKTVPLSGIVHTRTTPDPCAKSVRRGFAV